jgi:hypothetical protein
LLIACKNVKLVKQGVEVNWTELIEQYNRNTAVFDNQSVIREEDGEEIDIGNESQEELPSDVESLDMGEEENKQIGN